MKADFMRDRSGAKVRIYSCRGKRSSGTCRSRSAVLGSVVEPWVVERFFERAGDFKVGKFERAQAVEDAERDLAAAETELEAFLLSDVGSIAGAERFREGVVARQAVIDEAQEALAAATGAAGWIDHPELLTMQGMWPTLEVAHQRSLLAAGIDAIFLRSVGQANTPIADRARILWRGEAPADLPGMGRRVSEIRPFDWDGIANPPARK
jgi:hypothetical protein